MICANSEGCHYYTTCRDKSGSKQYSFLIANYCEGSLQAKCRRIQYETEFHKVAPPELAPNGYRVGTHEKLKTDNTRRFKRFSIEKGTCLLEVPGTSTTLSAGIIDLSEGGMRLELDVSPAEIALHPGGNRLKIVDYTIEEAPLPLTREYIRMVWHNNQVIGCCFDPAPA